MLDDVLNFIQNTLTKLPGGNYLDNNYVFAAVTFLFFLIAGRVALFLIGLYLDKVAGKTKTKFDDMIFGKTRKPVFYLITFYGIKSAVLILNLGPLFVTAAESLMAIAFVLFLLRVMDTLISTWGIHLAKKTKNPVDEVLLPIIQKTAKVVFFVIGFMWVLNLWSINITPYLAGVGLSGLVLGLALQDTLKNVFGGVSLLLDKNFNLGEPVRLESGELGKIYSVGLRSTKVMTYDNEVVFVPNGQLANMRIVNFVRPNTRIRKIVDFSVAYGTEVAKVQRIVMDAMKKVEGIYNDPYMDVIFTQMGDSGLHFKARFFTDWENAYSKWLEVTDVIYKALGKAKIEIPFPTRTVYMRK